MSVHSKRLAVLVVALGVLALLPPHDGSHASQITDPFATLSSVTNFHATAALAAGASVVFLFDKNSTNLNPLFSSGDREWFVTDFQFTLPFLVPSDTDYVTCVWDRIDSSGAARTLLIQVADTFENPTVSDSFTTGFVLRDSDRLRATINHNSPVGLSVAVSASGRESS